MDRSEDSKTAAVHESAPVDGTGAGSVAARRWARTLPFRTVAAPAGSAIAAARRRSVDAALAAGQAAFAAGRYGRALHQFGLVLRLEPGHPEARRQHEAVQTFLAFDRERYFQLYRQATEHFRARDFERARLACRAILERHPDDPDARALLEKSETALQLAAAFGAASR